MTLGPHLLEFSKVAIAAIQSHRSSAILLDMSGVEAIDSAGLGELVILYTAAGQSQCRLALLNPSPHIIRLLETTRLSGLLPHFDGNASAIPWIRNGR